MYTVLNKDTIKNEILSHLSKAKHDYVTQSCLIDVINTILYKLKTGCQWVFFPVESLFSGKVLIYDVFFQHYRKWYKAGEWKSIWIYLLDKHHMELDLSCVDLDGSHTTALRGGVEVGYQGRKKRKTTNALYLTDRQGIPLAMYSSKLGERNDVHDIENVVEGMLEYLGKSNIRVDGLFLNADTGFDCDALRNISQQKEIIANICINKRRENTDNILVDDELYVERYSIERTNA